jgi:hypothetical protein
MSQAFDYAVIILLPVSYAEIQPTITDRNVGYDGLPLPAPNLLFLVCAGTRPRVGRASDRSAVDRANTAAENLRGLGLFRSRLASVQKLPKS